MARRPEAAAPDDNAAARFTMGHAVGEEACRQSSALHERQGVMIEAEPDLAAALERTDALLASGHDGPLFEATFQHDGLLVRCDILEPDGAGGWRMIEVKSSTAPKDYHRADLATQVWVARQAGVALSAAAIRHIDRAFVLAQETDYSGLFADAELLAELEAEVADVPVQLSAARETLTGPEPMIAPGDHCSSPFQCEFGSYCRSALPPGPEWPVDYLPAAARKKAREAGLADMTLVDPAGLKGNAARVFAATVSGVPDHDPDGAAGAMSGWTWPRTWLDFETINPAMPLWPGTRPYEQVPFQFTAIIEATDGSETLFEFLHLDPTDPRQACAEMLASLPREGAVIAYNAAFEGSVLRKLAEAVPHHAEALLSLVDRLVDLLPVTRDHWYHRDQCGSWSIKAVLPTLAPDLGYGSLEVQDGGAAQTAWREAVSAECAPERRQQLDGALRRYCGLDVEAMRVVARRISIRMDETGSGL